MILAFTLAALSLTSLTAGSIVQRDSSARTAPPPGCVVVNQAGTSPGGYATIGSALTAMGRSNYSAACMFIYPGTYREQLEIRYSGPLTIYGYTTNINSPASNQVVMTYNQSSLSGGAYVGATVAAMSYNFSAWNLNMTNTFGTTAQALALFAGGDMQGYYACAFIGYQDTVFAGYNRQYYSKCYFEGAVDFIYGFATAWFNRCTIAVTRLGWIVANGRRTNDSSLFVIDHCTIQAATGFTEIGTSHLGRAWGVLSKVIYQYSTLSDIINPAGWAPMTAGATPVFMEYGNTGAGSNTSARELETPVSKPYTLADLFPAGYSWADTAF